MATRVSDVLKVLEGRFNCMIVDETELSGRFGFRIRLSSLDDVRQSLEKDYGILLTREERDVELLHITSDNNPKDAP